MRRRRNAQKTNQMLDIQCRYHNLGSFRSSTGFSSMQQTIFDYFDIGREINSYNNQGVVFNFTPSRVWRGRIDDTTLSAGILTNLESWKMNKKWIKNYKE